MLTLWCRKHPRYRGIRDPRPSATHPEGCLTCWTIRNLVNAVKARRIEKTDVMQVGKS